jgi:hypothetical protein
MKQDTYPRARFAVFAALLPAVLLGACRSDNTLEITDDGMLKMTMDVVDDEGLMLGTAVDDCASLIALAGDSANGLKDATVEDITVDGHPGCRVTTEEAVEFDGVFLIDNGDSMTFNVNPGLMPDVGDDADLLENTTFSLRVVLPGDITEADNGGQIEGNTAVYTDISVLETGFSVTGGKGSLSSSGSTASADPSDTPSSSTTPFVTTPDPTVPSPIEPPATEGESDSGFPVWAWVLIAVGAIALAGGGIFLATRKKGGPGNQSGYPSGPGTPGGSPTVTASRVQEQSKRHTVAILPTDRSVVPTATGNRPRLTASPRRPTANRHNRRPTANRPLHRVTASRRSLAATANRPATGRTSSRHKMAARQADKDPHNGLLIERQEPSAVHR